MWIRSQNKETLIYVQKFEIYAVDKILINGGELGGYIRDVNGRYAINDLGGYSNKEKALKVLDMMERHIDNQGFIRGTSYTNVFQMPQDDELKGNE